MTVLQHFHLLMLMPALALGLLPLLLSHALVSIQPLLLALAWELRLPSSPFQISPAPVAFLSEMFVAEGKLPDSQLKLAQDLCRALTLQPRLLTKMLVVVLEMPVKLWSLTVAQLQHRVVVAELAKMPKLGAP